MNSLHESNDLQNMNCLYIYKALLLNKLYMTYLKQEALSLNQLPVFLFFF
jgi:hypothetical protein